MKFLRNASSRQSTKGFFLFARKTRPSYKGFFGMRGSMFNSFSRQIVQYSCSGFLILTGLHRFLPFNFGPRPFSRFISPEFLRPFILLSNIFFFQPSSCLCVCENSARNREREWRENFEKKVITSNRKSVGIQTSKNILRPFYAF